MQKSTQILTLSIQNDFLEQAQNVILKLLLSDLAGGFAQVSSIIYTWTRPLMLTYLPGLHMADTTVFLAVAQTLAVFNISKKIRDGVVIEPDREYKPGTVR